MSNSTRLGPEARGVFLPIKIPKFCFLKTAPAPSFKREKWLLRIPTSPGLLRIEGHYSTRTVHTYGDAKTPGKRLRMSSYMRVRRGRRQQNSKQFSYESSLDLFCSSGPPSNPSPLSSFFLFYISRICLPYPTWHTQTQTISTIHPSTHTDGVPRLFALYRPITFARATFTFGAPTSFTFLQSLHVRTYNVNVGKKVDNLSCLMPPAGRRWR